MKKIIELIDNKIQFGNYDSYCAILGESPSKGARSPVLWNACFKELNISSYFYPFDVSTNRLKDVVECIKHDKNFVGGACAVPYKEAIIPFLDKVEDEADKIGAVNLIYKKDGKMIGSNTDGLGFVGSMAEHLNSSIERFGYGKKVVIFGTGGAAKACAVYLAKCLGQDGELFIVGRSENKVNDLVKKCSDYTHCLSIDLKNIGDIISSVHFLVNSTSLGYENIYVAQGENYYLEPFTPLGPTPDSGFKSTNNTEKKEWIRYNQSILQKNFSDTVRYLSKLNPECQVIDVVYQPPQTMLLKLAKYFGLNTFTGQSMNLLQAAYGFIKAFNDFEDRFNEIKIIMQKC